jgi:hypothetical protein
VALVWLFGSFPRVLLLAEELALPTLRFVAGEAGSGLEVSVGF